MKISVEVDVDPTFVTDILTVAAEGGIGYWADYKCRRHEDLSVYEITAIKDAEGDDDFPKNSVDENDILDVLEKISQGALDCRVSWTWQDHITKAIIEGDAGYLDSDDCDMIVQIALFGEVVYG